LADVKTLSYKKIPVRAVSELLKFFDHVKNDLKEVNVPTLIIYAEKDHVIAPKSAKLIYDRISSKDKRILKLTKSYHILTLDVEKETVFLESLRFIEQII
jgi:carboxylesterase